MEPPAELAFLAAVERFRRGPAASTEDVEAVRLEALVAAAARFLAAVEPAAWGPEATLALVFAVARDEEGETLADALQERPGALRAALAAALEGQEPAARWQLGVRLARADGPAAAPALRRLAEDPDEYVRRRALLELGRLRDPAAEALAERAWATGHEYQRLAALLALSDLGSPRLAALLARAGEDGRESVLKAAARLKGAPTRG